LPDPVPKARFIDGANLVEQNFAWLRASALANLYFHLKWVNFANVTRRHRRDNDPIRNLIANIIRDNDARSRFGNFRANGWI
jgi:hypothetical protein